MWLWGIFLFWNFCLFIRPKKWRKWIGGEGDEGQWRSFFVEMNWESGDSIQMTHPIPLKCADCRPSIVHSFSAIPIIFCAFFNDGWDIPIWLKGEKQSSKLFYCSNVFVFADQLYDNYYKSTGMLFRARRGSSSTAALVGGGSRRRRGIIFECCTNKCSLNYIRNNYCAQGPSSHDGPIPSSWQFVEEANRKRRR